MLPSNKLLLPPALWGGLQDGEVQAQLAILVAHVLSRGDTAARPHADSVPELANGMASRKSDSATEEPR